MNRELIFHSFKKYKIFLIVIILCLIYFWLGILGMQAHTDLAESDTFAYLSAASRIKQMGFWGLIASCFRGEYKDANRHPIYMMLISPIVERNAQAFVNAKKITFVIGLIFTILFFMGIYRLYGVASATISVLLVIFNLTFLQLSTMVTCEVLFMLFLFLSWYFMVLGFKNKKFWLYSGLFSALTYLSKATGTLILPTFFISVFLYYRKNIKQILVNKYFWGFFFMFFLISSPYIVRNVRVYKDPFYNTNKKYFWIDKYTQKEMPGFHDSVPNLKSYLQRHSFGELFISFTKGIFVRVPQLLVESLKPFPFWQRSSFLQLKPGATPSTGMVYPIIIAVFSIYGLQTIRKHDEFIVTFTWVIIIYILLSWWSKILFAKRFSIPLLLFIFIYAGRGIVSFGTFILSKIKWTKWNLCLRYAPTIFFIIFLLWFGVSLAKNNQWDKVDIDNSYSLPKNYEALSLWLEQNIEKDDKYLIGKVYSFPLEFFDEVKLGSRMRWPQFKSLKQLKEYIKTNNIKYGLLDLQTFIYRLNIFRNHFGYNKMLGIIPMKEIRGFKIVAVDPTLPRVFIVMEFNHGEL